ncbi:MULTISPECIES: septum formation initiator family protein [Jeotgalicoccus]|uniref:FtsB family cell division protein n=1 Tax=Jeotgalicoccus TaxID=227979 RepID=UPI0003F9091F|nr:MULTISPECIES: septum formation initiator family protein [Jeotgalicoccus]QQD84669.1 septum formation initiator family protein [Jeotgalicoccus sp. ATCC 8456]
MNNKVVRLLNNYTKKRDSEKKQLKTEARVSRRRALVFGSVLMIIVIVLLMIGINQKKANQELEQEVAATSEVLDNKNKQHSDLEQQIKQLNDDNYILRIARSEFFLSEEGELIFNLPEGESGEERPEKE